jgi:hypothetical protein
MQGVFQLPRFAVVVWLCKTTSYPAIRDELLELAAEDPYESTESKTWSFIIGALTAWLRRIDSPVRRSNFAEKPEIGLLRIQSGEDVTPSKR